MSAGREKMDNQFLAEEISKREYQVTNKDKMIKYLQEGHKKRGEEIFILKDKLHRRNMQIEDLKKTVEGNFSLYKKAMKEVKKYSDYVIESDLQKDFNLYLASKGDKEGFEF